MTSSRRDVQQHLIALDDLADALGVDFATNTRDAFVIIDAVERMCRARERSLAAWPAPGSTPPPSPPRA